MTSTGLVTHARRTRILFLERVAVDGSVCTEGLGGTEAQEDHRWEPNTFWWFSINVDRWSFSGTASFPSFAARLGSRSGLEDVTIRLLIVCVGSLDDSGKSAVFFLIFHHQQAYDWHQPRLRLTGLASSDEHNTTSRTLLLGNASSLVTKQSNMHAGKRRPVQVEVGLGASNAHITCTRGDFFASFQSARDGRLVPSLPFSYSLHTQQRQSSK